MKREPEGKSNWRRKRAPPSRSAPGRFLASYARRKDALWPFQVGSPGFCVSDAGSDTFFQ